MVPRLKLTKVFYKKQNKKTARVFWRLLDFSTVNP